MNIWSEEHLGARPVVRSKNSYSHFARLLDCVRWSEPIPIFVA